jgi:hypothetical protein
VSFDYNQSVPDGRKEGMKEGKKSEQKMGGERKGRQVSK